MSVLYGYQLRVKWEQKVLIMIKNGNEKLSVGRTRMAKQEAYHGTEEVVFNTRKIYESSI